MPEPAPKNINPGDDALQTPARDQARVAETVGAWKDALLDLSDANPLIALPTTAVVDMSAPNDVFDPLVRRRKPLHYWDLSNKSLDRNVLREPGNYAARTAAMGALRALHTQAVALLTGQDINVLFVAFGVLTWIDPASGAAVRSPLLLVPVALEPRPDGAGYAITAMEEPVEVNPVLRLRLAMPDIGFALPPSPDERYLIPSSYLGSLSALCEEREGWSVEERTVLGRFPLLKLRLYEDLTAQESRALSHPLIAALAGETEALAELPAVVVPRLSELEHDDAAESQFLLLDADPAQERAVVAAARGQSFVLQGPPGTGKTQTITNIIGECAAAGKSVLLVSGRMASLDAVYQRLSERGLGDLCLLAHSLKTSKRDILAQLEATLGAPAKLAGGAAVRAARQKERDEIRALRSHLNTFTHALHQKHSPLGMSVYDAAGEIAAADVELAALGAEPLRFTVREIRDIAPDERDTMRGHAVSLGENPTLLEADGDAPWAEAFRDPYRSDLAATAARVLGLFDAGMRGAEAAGRTLAALCGLPAPFRLADAEDAARVAGVLVDTGGVMVAANWLGADDPAALRARAEDLVGRYAAFRDAEAVLLSRWGGGIFLLLHASLAERLDDKYEALLAPLLGGEWRDQAVAGFAQTAAALDAVAQNGRVLHERLSYLADRGGMSLGGDLESRQRLLKIARQAIDLPNPCVGWFAPGAAERLGGHLNDAEEQWERYRKGTEVLFSLYSEEVLDLDHAELLQTLDGQRGGFGRIISTFNNRVASALRAVTRPGVNTRDRDVETDLQLAAAMKDVRRWCQQSAERLSSSFGSYYLGQNTDWNGLRAQLAKSAELCAEFDSARVPAPLIALMLLGDSDLKQFETVFAQIGVLLMHLRSAWEKLSGVVVSPTVLPDPTTPLPILTQWCEERHSALADFYDAYRTVADLRSTADAGAPPVPVAEIISDLRAARRLAGERLEFEGEFGALGAVFGDGYRGTETDWDALWAGLSAAARYRALFPGGLPARLTARLAAETAAGELEELSRAGEAVTDAILVLEPILAEMDALFKPEYLRLTVADGGDVVTLRDATFADALEWAAARLAATDGLGNSVQVQALRDACHAHRLDGFFDALAQRAEPLPPAAVPAAFLSGFYRVWTEAILSDTPGIAPFRGAAHEARIERFRDLDRHQMEVVPGLIRELARLRSPKQFPDEVKTLKGQLARRRTGEVRRLLADIPGLLFALKPIVMMNPLSVRLFLDADVLRFDVVLFDDASQISTEDAIGAILRGKQVIIAGDPQQIPPLALLVEAEKEFESILDAASAVAGKDSAHFGAHTLRWHYRSRNESLIAFSRRYFYPELVSFPSATVDGAIDYLPITEGDAAETESEGGENAITDSGAARVIDAVLTYAAANPGHSVGVVALDDTDYERIAAEIARRREADPEWCLPRENEDTGEAFFLKTLENVQGDERDIIVLFVGADPSRCRPLSAYGGERLLNVAITRARSRMIVVSAFAHDAPRAEGAVEHRGMLLLRSFLRYAQQGARDEAMGRQNGAGDDPAASLLLPGTHTPDVPAQSLFEQTVERLLAERGHQVRRQVGLSEYRVDLAVVDPDKPGRYLLGIEFDGPMYASGETARHRDRLRVDMLTDRGWNLHRVWSLDFEADPRGEIARIEAAIAAARKAGTPKPKAAKRVGAKKAADKGEEAVAEIGAQGAIAAAG